MNPRTITLAMLGLLPLGAVCALAMWGAWSLLSSEGEVPAPTGQLIDIYSGPPTAEPSATRRPSATPDADITPSPTRLPLTEELAAVNGVTLVRVVNIIPVDDRQIAFLEIDVERRFVTEEMAEALREITFSHFPNITTEFSVVLWDRASAATNFTWDIEAELWRSSRLTNNPG